MRNWINAAALAVLESIPTWLCHPTCIQPARQCCCLDTKLDSSSLHDEFSDCFVFVSNSNMAYRQCQSRLPEAKLEDVHVDTDATSNQGEGRQQAGQTHQDSRLRGASHVDFITLALLPVEFLCPHTSSTLIYVTVHVLSFISGFSFLFLCSAEGRIKRIKQTHLHVSPAGTYVNARTEDDLQ